MHRTLLKFVGSASLGMTIGIAAKRSVSANDLQTTIPSEKRKNYLKWEDYFMSIALVSGQRSKDPVTQVGACIVNQDNRIVGVGYNGFPIGCSDDSFPWSKDTADPMDSKQMYVVHAEENAVINRFSADLKNSTIYVSLFPCNRCAQMIIQSGIKKVIYMSDKKSYSPSVEASKRMLNAAGVEYTMYKPSNKGLSLNFTDFDDQKIIEHKE